MDYQIAGPSHKQFMQEMLYEAVFWGPNNRPSKAKAFALPDVAKVLSAWSDRTGDTGLIAYHDKNTPVGAAWYRFWQCGDQVRGYIDDETPVLVIAVKAEFRGQGVGGALLTQLKALAFEQPLPYLSLMVSKQNPALSLYQKQGFDFYEDKGTSLLMRATLASNTI